MTDRRRNLLILLLVAGLLAASAVVVATKPTRLGLDLRGGVELTYQAKPTPQQQVTPEAIGRAIEIMRERVDSLGVSEPEIQRFGEDLISVALPDVENAARAERQVGQVAQLYFYDWEPNVIGEDGDPITDAEGPVDQEEISQANAAGSLDLFQAVERASEREPDQDRDNTTGPRSYLVDPDEQRVVAGPADTREDLLEEFDGRQPEGTEVRVVPTGTLIVEAEQDEIVNRLASQARIPDADQLSRAELVDRIEEELGYGPEAERAKRYYVIQDDPAIVGTDIENPEQNFDPQTQEPVVTMEFTDEGREAFARITRQIAERGQRSVLPGSDPTGALQHFAIVLDNELVSRPQIDFNRYPTGIDGSNGAEISGGFTIETAQTLSNFLRIGALPIELELISQTQVSATLGQQSLDQGLVAGAAGLLLVVLFLLAFYRVLGLIAAGTLLVYAVYLYALIELIPITLTLPGIAGLILTIGVAADANIVIFERIKEEVRAGRGISAAVAQGYKKGLSAIIDANVVTIMVAFILFVLATAGVRGFAFTLGVGALISLFTAVLAVSAILGAMANTRLIRRPSALGAGRQRARFRFDYMGASRFFFSASGVILLIGALAIGGKGLDFGIDFESGSRIRAAVEERVDENAVRDTLATAGFDEAEIQRLEDPALIEETGADAAFQISTSTLRPNQVDEVRTALEDEFGVAENGFATETIGPTFGEAVANSAVIAIIASLLVISVYIALRFEWKFAVPVLIALSHDLLITAGVYALVGREVTTATVAALLTILGFSLYDTIIVFDRIRENVPRMPRAAFSQIVNRSMSEVLARSLATSLCVALPILSLMLFGGETLRDFAFALLIGTISGTYSSIFIASPVLTAWKEREGVYVRRRRAIAAENDGTIPAYATAGAAVEAAPEERRPARRSGPEGPEGAQLSKEEFDELVAQNREVLEEDPELARTAASRGGAAVSTAKRPAGEAPAAAPGGRPRGGRRARRAGADGGDGGNGAPRGATRAEDAPAPPPTGDGPDGGTGGGGGAAGSGGPGDGGATAEGGPKPGRPAGGRRARNKRHGRPR